MTQHIFLHIPKTAGSSIRTLLQQNYDLERTIGFSGDRNAIDWYLRQPLEFKCSKALLHGHFEYGLHAGVPAYTYFTLLRDPVDRHFSDYFFLKKYTDHALHERIATGKITLQDWASFGTRNKWYRDLSTRVVSGEGLNAGNQCGHTLSDLDRASLEKAKYHVRKDFACVGLAERFDESVLLLAKRLGWKSVFYLTRNVTAQRDAVTPDLRERAREQLTLDYELYDFAQQAFEASPELHDPLFAPALAEYRDALAWVSAQVGNDQHGYFVVGQDELPQLDALVRQHRSLPALDRFLASGN